jgi:protein-tyrosine phosphatase
VLICDNIEKMPMLENLCIEGTNTMLIELPFTDISKSHLDSVRSLIKSGFNIVLAHADRYSPDEIEAFIALGAKIQLNADSLDKLFIKKHLINWIDRDVVVAIGSDIHSDDKNAYKHLINAIKKLGTRAEKIAEKSNAIWN